MAIRTFCDCGCGRELAEHDAGQTPVVLQTERATLSVTVLPLRGVVPNIRPACIQKIVAEAEQIFPPVAQLLDPGAEERAAKSRLSAGQVRAP